MAYEKEFPESVLLSLYIEFKDVQKRAGEVQVKLYSARTINNCQ